MSKGQNLKCAKLDWWYDQPRINREINGCVVVKLYYKQMYDQGFGCRVAFSPLDDLSCGDVSLSMMDPVSTSITQALWSSGLFVKGSMHMLVTSTSGDLYSVSIGIAPIEILVWGNTTPALVFFHQTHSFSL